MSYVFNIFQKNLNKTDDSWKRKIIAAVKMRRREYYKVSKLVLPLSHITCCFEFLFVKFNHSSY